MVSLLDLPVEILTEIAAYLSQPCTRRFQPWPTVAGPRNNLDELFKLCRTCSVLRAIAQSIIFRDVHIHYRNTDTSGTFQSLAHTLIRRPPLAREARNIVLDRWPLCNSGFTVVDDELVGKVDAEDVWRVALPKLALLMLAVLSSVTGLHLRGSHFNRIKSHLTLGTYCVVGLP